MDLRQLLDRLVEAETDSPDPEYVGRRYVLVGYGPGGDRSGVVLGEADSVHAALDLLAAHFVRLFGEEPDPDELTASFRPAGVAEDDYERWLGDDTRRYAGSLRAIRTPRRRALAYYLIGLLSGPMDIVTGRHANDPYLGAAPLRYPGSRFVFLISAMPPTQDEAYGILECQPVGTPS